MQIQITLNGRKTTCEANQTILEVAKGQGLQIPNMCADEKLEPFGSCWVCLVEVKGARGFVPACATRCSEGMEVETNNDRIRVARTMALELLLSNHFGDCIGPCQQTCPAGCDAQGYLALAANGMEKEAIRLIKETLPLPASLGRVCPHPCEAECRRNLVEEPVSICAVKRTLADNDLNSGQPYLPVCAPLGGQRVAVVGAGPAGLSAAYYLRQAGIAVTLLDALPKAGGWLRYGIPQYRLPKEVLDQEIETITSTGGIEIRAGQRLGRDFTLADLQGQFDAVLLAFGAHASMAMGVEGEDLPEVLSGIDFLKAVALGAKVEIGERVAVVGGGNTAIDAARTVLRLGAQEVTVFYRRTEAEMPANPSEVEEARKEGVRFQFLAAPLQVLACSLDREGSLLCQRMTLGEPDASGRRRPVPVSGSDFQASADTIISCIGQRTDLAILGNDSGIKMTRWSTVETDPETGATALQGVFAAGDLVSGPATVVEAIGGARKAADAISRYLEDPQSAWPPKRLAKTFNTFKGMKLKDISASLYQHFPSKERARMPMLEMPQRLHFDEVDLGLTAEQTREEALRCLECGCADVTECKLRDYAGQYEVMVNRFLGEVKVHPIDESHPFLVRDPSKCILCGRCIRICLEVVGAAALGFVYRGYSTIMAPTLEKPFPESPCVSCGACIETCPVGALGERSHQLRIPHLAMRKVPAVCTSCGVGCSLHFHLEEDKVVKVTGNAESPVNAGALCFKGKFGFELIHSRDRILRPQLREGGISRPVSWKEALAWTQQRFEETLHSFGPESIAVFASGRSTCEEAMALKYWASRLGSRKFASFQYVGSGTPLLAFAQVIGKSTGAGYDHLDTAATIFLIGSDLTHQHPVLSQRVRRAVKRGAKLYSLQEQTTEMSVLATKEWLVRPGGIPWALNGVLKALIEVGHVAPELGYQDLRKTLAELSKTTLNKVTGWKSGVYQEIVQMLALRLDCLFLFPADAINRETGKALGNLLLLLGRPESFLALRGKANIRGVDRFLTCSADSLLEEMRQGTLKAAFLLNEDPVGALPLGGEIANALCQLDTLVVADLFPSPTTGLAHLVLPASSFAESDGSYINSEGRVQRFRQAIPPLAGLTSFAALSQLSALGGPGEPLFEIPAPRSYPRSFAMPEILSSERMAAKVPEAAFYGLSSDIWEARLAQLKKEENIR